MTVAFMAPALSREPRGIAMAPRRTFAVRATDTAGMGNPTGPGSPVFRTHGRGGPCHDRSVTPSILLVDDDPGFRRLARQALGRRGLAVIGEADTVAAAKEAAQGLRPDMVLVDVGLPDGDGVTLAASLVALPWGPRVVLMSGDPDAATEEDVHLSGAKGFVHKSELSGAGLDLLLAAE
jgi:CheY-like chemotaxis protein